MSRPCVVLINAPAEVYSDSRALPLGLCYLAAVSKELGLDTEIVDAMQQTVLSSEEVVKILRFPQDKNTFVNALL